VTASEDRRPTHILEGRLRHLAAGLPSEDQLTKWGVVFVATWIYIHLFVLAANRASLAMRVEGAAWYVFVMATYVGFLGGPAWICAALPSVLVSRRATTRAGVRVRVILVILASLIGVYAYIAVLE
jgi:hypothetical protein